MVKPFTPEEVIDTLPDHFPDFVIKSVNNLLLKHYRKGYCSFKKKELISEMIKVSNHAVKSEDLYENNYLDIEPIFRKFGWEVEFASPDRDENFDDYYKFTKIKE